MNANIKVKAWLERSRQLEEEIICGEFNNWEGNRLELAAQIVILDEMADAVDFDGWRYIKNIPGQVHIRKDSTNTRLYGQAEVLFECSQVKSFWGRIRGPRSRMIYQSQVNNPTPIPVRNFLLGHSVAYLEGKGRINPKIRAIRAKYKNTDFLVPLSSENYLSGNTF